MDEATPVGSADLIRQYNHVWPWAAAQSLQVHAMLRRLVGWRTMVENLDDYFKAMTQMEQQYSDSAQKVLQTLKEPQGDYGQLNVGLLLMRQHHEKVAAGHQHFATRLQTKVCSRLSKLRREFCGDVSNIIAEIEKLENGIRALREDTLTWMVTFEKSYWASEASKDNTLNDPWITEKILKEKSQKLHFEEQTYQRAMSGFFDELLKMDTFLSESVQNVLGVYSSCISHDSTDLQQINQQLLNTAELLQPLQEFNDFLNKTGLANREVWKREITPITYRFQNGPLAKIFKRGMLQRRIGTLAIGWKEAFVVVTESAYLHVFDSENIEEAQPIASVCLRRAEVEFPSTSALAPNQNAPGQFQNSFVGTPLQNTFDVVSPQAYRFTTAARLTFMAQSSQELEEWIFAIKLKETEPEQRPSIIEEVRHEGNEDFVLLANQETLGFHTASHPNRVDLRRNISSELRDDYQIYELDDFGSPSQPKKKPNTSRSPKKTPKLLVHHDDMDAGEPISADYAFVDASH